MAHYDELRYKDLVMVISTCYLEPICNHSNKYTFSVVGYPTFEDASTSFLYNNISKYLAIIVSVEKFEKTDLVALFRILKMVDLMKTNLPILISHNDMEKMAKLKSVIKHHNLNVNITEIFTDNVELEMSDTFIHTNLYLPIIKSRFPAYRFREFDEVVPYDTMFRYRGYDNRMVNVLRPMRGKDYTEGRPLVLEHVPLITDIVQKTLEDINVKPNLESTIFLDSILKELEGNLFYYNVRRMMIYILHKEDYSDIEDSINRLLPTVDDRITLKSVYLAGKRRAMDRRLELDKLDRI